MIALVESSKATLFIDGAVGRSGTSHQRLLCNALHHYTKAVGQERENIKVYLRHSRAMTVFTKD